MKLWKTVAVCMTISIMVLLCSCGVKTESIKFSTQSMELTIGDTEDFTVTLTPDDAADQEYTIASQDTEICTVDGNTVTAVAPGLTSITIYQGDTLYDQCAVLVKDIQAVSISLNSDDFDGKIGHSAELSVSYLPENAEVPEVVYTVSDDTIAEINDGIVTWLAPGNVTIEAVDSELGLSDSCEVTVTEIEPESVSVDDLTLEEGEEADASWQVYPEDTTNQDLLYISGDESVFTVSDTGVVTAVAPGTANLYVGYSTELYGTGTVTVTGVLADSVSVTGKSGSIYVGEGVQLYASVAPENTYDKSVSWSSSNTSVAKVSNNGYVTGAGVGNATITAKTSNGKTDTFSISVSLESQTPPYNGEILYKNSGYGSWSNSLTIDNGWDNGVCFVIKTDATHWVETVYVHAHSSTTIALPYGTFRVKYASSPNWYGYENQKYDPDCQFFIYKDGLDFIDHNYIYYPTFSLTQTYGYGVGGSTPNEVDEETYEAW